MPLDEIKALLKVCAENNSELDLTGILLHKDGNFLQVLEGPEDNVKKVLEKIYRDPRHRGIIKLLDGYSDQRQFPDWRMAFRDLHDLSLIKNPGYSEFLNTPLTGTEFESNPTKVQRLLLNFRNRLR